MPARTARANARKSAVRAHIEHVFAEQKARMGLFVRTIGLARATTKIGFANLVHNMRRLTLARTAADAHLTTRPLIPKCRPPHHRNLRKPTTFCPGRYPATSASPE